MFRQAMNDVGNLRRTALWFVLTISVLNLCACNTVAGFGRDMEHLGDRIENKVAQKKHGDEMKQEARKRREEPVREASQHQEDTDGERTKHQKELERMYQEHMEDLGGR